MRKRRRGKVLGVAALTTALALLGLLPTSASAITVTTTTAEGATFELDLDDLAGVKNEVGFAIVTPTGGMPDLVVGDLTAGIPDPIPSFCQRVDSLTIRCAEFMISRVDGSLGAGNDIWGVGITQDVDTAALSLFTAYMGAGNDRASGGAVPNDLHGGPGHDVLQGGPDRDSLYGNGQNDFMIGHAGADLFRCGGGKKDRFDDGPGKDRVEVGSCEIRVHAQF